MTHGSGVRRVTRYVRFNKKFTQIPTVSVSFQMIDSYHGRNLRIRTYVTDISEIGFNLQFNTWDRTIIYGATASWIAFGV